MIWLTEIQANDPITGEIQIWAGPEIEANTEQQAIDYCNSNGLGYCKVIGCYDEASELISGICEN
ncbi:MAG: hypothetical protein ABFC18_03230 [Rikenellaceae bacterium]